MSSRLCKQLEGAVFPLRTVLLKDRIEDAVHALDIDETNHGTGPTANLHEAALDGVGGAELPPEVAREVKEGEQFREVLLQAAHHRRIDRLPLPPESREGVLSLPPVAGQVEGLGPGLDRVVIPLPHSLQDVPHLVHPAALMLNARVDGLDRGGQTRAAIGHDELELPAFQPRPI